MGKLDFVSSFIDNENQYKTWQKYAKNIYNISNEHSDNTDLITIFCETVYKLNKETYAIKSIIDKTRQLTDTFVLLNSDIELADDDETWEKITNLADDFIIAGHRYNYTNSYQESTLNNNGIDFFVINKHLNIPTDYNFCIGLCSWDWWIPYLATTQQIPLAFIKKPFIYHKNHPKRWNMKSCQEMMKYFENITGYSDPIFKKHLSSNANEI